MEKLLEELQYRRKLINECHEKIRFLKTEISVLNEQLYNTCDHKWERVSDYADDDLCKHMCNKCHLWRNIACNE